MQRAQSHDESWHAGFHPNPLTLDPVGRCRGRPIHPPKRPAAAPSSGDVLGPDRPEVSAVYAHPSSRWPSCAQVVTDQRPHDRDRRGAEEHPGEAPVQKPAENRKEQDR